MTMQNKRSSLLGPLWASLGFGKTTEKLAAPKQSSRGPLRHKMKVRQYRIKLELKNWTSAVLAAEDEFRPDRRMIYDIYKLALEDENLLAQLRTARFNVQLAPFEILRDGQPDEEALEIFNAPWFTKYLAIAVDTELWGHSLLEFAKKVDGLFTELFLIPRYNVRPEPMFGDVMLDTTHLFGIPFRKGAVSKNLIELGDPYDLGLLKSLSKAIIRKYYNLNDWQIRNEKFGQPFITLKTATRDKAALDEREAFLQNMGSNSYAIIDDQDEMAMLESTSNSGGGHLTFETFNNYIDKVVTILINGQTGTTEEKAHVGSAEVHERLLNKYTLARLKMIQHDINFCLIPFLVKHEYPLDNCKIAFKDLEEKQDATPIITDPKNEGKSDAGHVDPNDEDNEEPKK